MEEWNKEDRPLVTDAHWSSLRNKLVEGQDRRKYLRIVLEEFTEYTSKMFVRKTPNLTSFDLETLQ